MFGVIRGLRLGNSGDDRIVRLQALRHVQQRAPGLVAKPQMFVDLGALAVRKWLRLERCDHIGRAHAARKLPRFPGEILQLQEIVGLRADQTRRDAQGCAQRGGLVDDVDQVSDKTATILGTPGNPLQGAIDIGARPLQRLQQGVRTGLEFLKAASLRNRNFKGVVEILVDDTPLVREEVLPACPGRPARARRQPG